MMDASTSSGEATPMADRGRANGLTPANWEMRPDILWAMHGVTQGKRGKILEILENQGTSGKIKENKGK